MNVESADIAARNEELGHYINKKRLTKGLGLRETARTARVDPTWLMRLEQGHYTSPDPRNLMKVARALEIDVEDLYAIAGLTSGTGLPGLAPYLRAKYDLPDDAVTQLEAHFELLNAKYQPKGDHDD